MTKKWNFKSWVNKFKEKFKKEEETPFYLPDEDTEITKLDEVPFERTGVKKDFKKGNSQKTSVLEILPSIFSTKKRPLVHKAFLLSLLLLLCYFPAKLAAILLTPKNLKTLSHNPPPIQIEVEPSSVWQGRQELLTSKDIFKTKNSNGEQGNKNIDNNQRCDEAEDLSKLPINLLSTSVLQDELKSLASVQVRGKNDFSHIRVGDEVDSLAKIFKIERLKVILKNLQNGNCEYIVNQEFEKEQKRIKSPTILSQEQFKQTPAAQEKQEGIKQAGNKICIARNVLDEKLKDFNKILSDAKAVPITNSDGTLAFKIVEIQPGSIYSHLNIQNNDIIKSINGKAIQNYNDVMGLFGKIRSVSNLSLNIERSGSSLPMKYEITKGNPSDCQ